MSKKIDLITVCFSNDMKLLQLQARSVRLFMDPSLVGQILLVINDRNVRGVERFIKRSILPEYGVFASKVRVLSGHTVIGAKQKRFGWGSQQALKLLAVRYACAATVMILDCKVHFVRSVTNEHIWMPDGRIKTRKYPVIDRFRGYFDNACNYFGVGSVANGQPVLPTVPPFIVPSKIVCQMLETMENQEGRSFFDLFLQKKRRFTEFYLLHAYMMSLHGGIDGLYKQTPFQAVSLMASFKENEALVAEKINALNETDTYCFAVHRVVLEAGNEAIADQIIAVWQQFGLACSEAESRSFLMPPQFPAKWRFWLF